MISEEEKVQLFNKKHDSSNQRSKDVTDAMKYLQSYHFADMFSLSQQVTAFDAWNVLSVRFQKELQCK